MKESEAKTKWCPFARGLYKSGDASAAINRPRSEESKEFTDCIGSDCMAWREDTYSDNKNEGYCGLVGEE